MTENANLPSNPSPSWQQLLAGTWPFIFFGPVLILLAYPYPAPEFRRQAWWMILSVVIYIVPLLLGLVIGAIKRFPTWSFPYTGLLLSIMSLAIASALVPLAFAINQELIRSLWFVIPFSAILIWLVSALVIWIVRFIPFLSPLHAALRRDWTLLSFALCMIPTWFSSQIDHEEEPLLTVSMFLSTVCLVLGALAFQLSRTRRQRFLSLLVGLALAVIFRSLDGNYVMSAYLLFGALVALAPSLLQLIPSAAKTVPSNA